MSRPSPSNRLIYTVARWVLSLVGGVLGYLFANVLIIRQLLTDPINYVYLTLLGFLCSYLLTGNLAKLLADSWERLAERIKKIPPDAVLAAGIGATVALFITVLLSTLLDSVPGFTWYWSLLITIFLVTASSWFFVVNRNLFFNRKPDDSSPVVPHKREEALAKVIDTSAIIDGRIADVIEANFFEGKLLVPQFVLAELQHIADSDDGNRRRRGRRGLEILDRLVQQTNVMSEVVYDDYPRLTGVDDKLLKLCQDLPADLVTTDFNLNRVAGLQGTRVLNVNQLANAIKAVYLPGERLSLHIVKEGSQQGQGLAYLEDGTMVVVEDSQDKVGETVNVIVTSNLQTNMGRMIFAKIE